MPLKSSSTTALSRASGPLAAPRFRSEKTPRPTSSGHLTARESVFYVSEDTGFAATPRCQPVLPISQDLERTIIGPFRDLER